MTETSATVSDHSLNTLLLLAAPLALGLLLWRRWYRLGDTPPRTGGISPQIGVILFVTMYFMGMVGTVIVRSVLYRDAAPADVSDMTLAELARFQIGSAVGQLIVVVVYAWMVSRSPQPGRRAVPIAALIGAGAFALVWPITASASFVAGLVASRVRGEAVEPIAHDTLQLMADTPPGGWFIVMVALVVVVVPVLEEIMYRGILQRMLAALGLSAWQAILLASVIFALMHVGAARWHALPALFVLSVGFGWAYEKTGRLAAPMIMHVLFNATNLGMVWLGGPGE